MLLAPFSARLKTTRLPSGENRGAKVMPGKSPSDFLLAGVDVEEIDPRRAAARRRDR